MGINAEYMGRDAGERFPENKQKACVF